MVLSLKENENPVRMFEKIKMIKKQFSRVNISEEELIAVIFEKSPKIYSGVVATEDSNTM